MRQTQGTDYVCDAVGAPDPATAATLTHATGVAVGPHGVIYVADTNNHVVRKILPSGAVTTIAGEAGHLGNNDGPATSARFNCPTDVAVDSRGNIWVAD